MSALLALLIGAAAAFAFQPTGWWPLMALALAALCELIARAPSLKRALLTGWLFGLGQFVISLNWIATAFTFQAKMPVWLGWVAVVLLSLYLAVYPMLAAGLGWRFGKDKPLPLVLALAGSWAITEWLRGVIFTGFAWNPVGVTLADTPWRETSATIGTYGLSILVVLVGGALWLPSRRQWRAPAAIAVVMALALLLPDPRVFDTQDGLMTFDASRQPQPPPPPMTPPAAGPENRPPPPETWPSAEPRTARAIRIVQPNIGQQDKWRPGFDAVAARKLDLLSIKGPPVTRLLFWPEAAVTNPLVDERAAARWEVESERLKATRSLGPYDLLLTGGLGLTSPDGLRLDGATNSVFVLAPLGKIVGRYDKAHLVPYGEYLPMRPLLSAIGLSRLAPGDLDFAPGPGPRTVTLPGGLKVGFQVCYEIIFPGQVVDRGNRPALIFNPSNDAWFGAWGPPQHLAQARLRAAEEGLPIVRSTPTGISALIDARGRVLQRIPLGKAGVIDGYLPMPAVSPTPFAQLGNIIPLALGFLMLIGAIALGRSRRYSAGT